MTVNVLSAAKRLGERSDWTLGNLQMQKMVYIAHMFFMGDTGPPLVAGTFQAWDYGPVHPKLYHTLKQFGADPVEPHGLMLVDAVPDSHPGARYLDSAVDQLPIRRLVAITHWKHGAWAKNYVPYERSSRISNEDILDEYRLRKENAAKRAAKRAARG